MKLLKYYGLALLSVFFAFAYANAQTGSIKIGGLSGTVTAINGGGASTVAVENETFTAPLTIITDGEASVILYLSNGSVVEVKPGSRIEINHFSQDPFEDSINPFQPLQNEPSSSQVSIRVVSGEIAANVSGLSPNSTFLISTPTSDITANEVITVVSFDAATATTEVSNVGGSGSLSFEPSAAAPGTAPVSVPSGQTLNVPGQTNPSTGAVTVSGQPTLAPASPTTVNAGNQVANAPVAPTGPATPAAPALPSAPAVPGTTPETDLPDLINPTSTEPNPV